MQFKRDILSPDINEAAYTGNLGFEEMVECYEKASATEIKELEKVRKNNDWNGFKSLIFKVLGKKLK